MRFHKLYFIIKNVGLIALLLVGSNLFGQPVEKKKEITDSIVSAIDKEAKKNIVSFKIKAVKKSLHYIDYNYQIHDGQIIKIARSFRSDNDSTRQVFYFKDDKLIFSTEGITSFFLEENGKDSSYWGGTYYFEKNILIDYVTLGHGKSESDDPNRWNPRSEVLKNCQAAKEDIKRYNSKKNNGG